MKTIWKWILGILAVVLVAGILAFPFLMHMFLPFGGYGYLSPAGHMPMMRGYGWNSPMPMMYGGWGFGLGALLGGLIQLGILVLIVLGIIWLVRALARQNTPKNN